LAIDGPGVTLAEGDTNPGLPIGDQLHDGSVVERLDHLSNQTACAHDGHIDLYPVRAPLVDRDGHREVRTVQFDGLGGDRWERIQVRQILQSHQIAELGVLEPSLALLLQERPDRGLQSLVLLLQRAVVHRSGEEITDRTGDIDDGLAQR
jgi:hypothetical protein